MAKFDVTNLFGVDIGFAYFNVIELIDALGIKNDVLKSKRVASLIKQHSAKHHIVTIAIRQVTLAELKPILNSKFLPFDPYFQVGDMHTAERERLYEAEEKLLFICWSLATGKSIKGLKRLKPDFNTRDWREMYVAGRSLYQLFRQILNDNTREYVLDYKQGNVDEDGRVNQPASVSAPPTPHGGISETTSLATGVIARPDRALSIEPTPYTKEIPVALRLMTQGTALIQEQVALLQTGKALDYPKLSGFVQKLIASHERNPYALLSLRHNKSEDAYLAQHTLGCAVLACHLAKGLELEPRYVEVISIAALLFDIGRFKLPAPIVNKAGKLSEAEYSLMRKHVHFGEGLLQVTPSIPKVVYQMLWDHHERVDGSGYPNGKEGGEISVYGKIGAIVDAYDSMTSEQAFKHSITPSGALRKMSKESGLAFDKKLLELFIKSLGSVPVGSCVELSNGRLGFVLTLNKQLKPSLVRQVYSLPTKTFIPAADIPVDRNEDVSISKIILPSDYDLRFVDHIS